MRKTMFALGLAAGATGCGQASEDALNREFDANFGASCVSAAVRGGAPEAVATQVCDCTLAAINERYDTAGKIALTAEQAQPLTAECMQKAEHNG